VNVLLLLSTSKYVKINRHNVGRDTATFHSLEKPRPYPINNFGALIQQKTLFIQHCLTGDVIVAHAFNFGGISGENLMLSEAMLKTCLMRL